MNLDYPFFFPVLSARLTCSEAAAMRGDSCDPEQPRSTCACERLPGRSCLRCGQRPRRAAPAASRCLMPGEPVTPPPLLHQALGGQPQRGFSSLRRRPNSYRSQLQGRKQTDDALCPSKGTGQFPCSLAQGLSPTFSPWEELLFLCGLILHQLLLVCFPCSYLYNPRPLVFNSYGLRLGVLQSSKLF